MDLRSAAPIFGRLGGYFGSRIAGGPFTASARTYGSGGRLCRPPRPRFASPRIRPSLLEFWTLKRPDSFRSYRT
jgi:hypothetical protein